MRLKTSARLKPAIEMCEMCGKAMSVVGCKRCGKAMCGSCRGKSHQCGTEPRGCSDGGFDAPGDEPLWAGRTLSRNRR